MPPEETRKQPRGQKEPRDAGETRRLLLQAAQDLFSTYGYRAVSTKQIAEACGVTQPALYRHFLDKQDLYVAMVLETLVPVKTALERIAQRALPVSERLRLVAIYLLATTRQDMMMMGHDMRYELSSQAQAQLMGTFNEAVIAPLTAILEDGMRQKELRSPSQGGTNASTAAFLFLNLASALVSQPLVNTPSSASVAERAQVLVNFTLHGLALPSEEKE